MPSSKVLLLVLLGLLCQTTNAIEPADIKQKLDQRENLREKINTLEKDQTLKRQAADQMRAELQRNEKQLVDAHQQLNDLQQKISAKQTHLGQLKQRVKQTSSKLEEQKTLLTKQIRAAYIKGRQDYLKLLLNQEDPALLSRNLAYHGYFNRARTRNIELVKEHLDELTKLEEAIKLEASTLRQLKQGQLAVVNQIEESKAERNQIMQKLDQQIIKQGDQLLAMQTDLSQLEELISGLEQQARKVDKQRVPFASMKGKLPWPTQGRLVKRFGSSRNKGSLRWQGVMLKAQAGTKVFAVSTGRVVFADWFRNLGLLVIIDHGDGYMTLYGHNQSLYKSVGDTVEGGELIATMGNTGGNLETSLYFEIREQGAPSDPARWCRPKNLSRS